MNVAEAFLGGFGRQEARAMMEGLAQREAQSVATQAAAQEAESSAMAAQRANALRVETNLANSRYASAESLNGPAFHGEGTLFGPGNSALYQDAEGGALVDKGKGKLMSPPPPFPNSPAAPAFSARAAAIDKPLPEKPLPEKPLPPNPVTKSATRIQKSVLGNGTISMGPMREYAGSNGYLAGHHSGRLMKTLLGVDVAEQGIGDLEGKNNGGGDSYVTNNFYSNSSPFDYGYTPSFPNYS